MKKAHKGPSSMIPLTWHNGKRKTVSTENTKGISKGRMEVRGEGNWLQLPVY
jgi:hypothetical protein